jgi:acyl-CoA synthetase (AMP-forming)/AMP-acid ligase II
VPQAPTILDILWRRAQQQPKGPAYAFVHARSGEESLTYEELAGRVRNVAGWLRAAAGSQDRALLVYPPGLDFIVSLFACMAARIIPVPVYPLIGANPDRSLARIQHIAADAGCRLILTTSDLLPRLEPHARTILPGSVCLATDNSPAEDFDPAPAKTDSLALLQYTSGSTALPRGVQITHGNLMANSAAIYDFYGLNSETRVVSWLPPYHDMGLIGGIVQPLFGGFPVTLMSPHAFLQNPVRWLEAISRTRATTSPSPNFGYDLCVRKVSPEAITRLDLGCWRNAICGAEPVSRSTLEQFAKTFAPAGFEARAFRPSYGLAEATLLVSASVGAAPVVRYFDRALLESGRVQVCAAGATNARALVGNGAAARGVMVKIVDPSTLELCPESGVGEVWTASASVASGYWNKPEVNASIFQARLAGAGETSFLRTGDLGFFHDGHLFLSGRIKDLIILAGRNHSAEDLEMAVRESHAAFEAMPGAAFSIDLDGREALAVVQEIKRQAMKPDLDPEELYGQVQRVLSAHNVRAEAIVLLRTGTIPRTSSGKVQRRQCREDLLQNRLQIFAAWRSTRALREVNAP